MNTTCTQLQNSPLQKKRKGQGGLIKTIVLIVIALLIISYYGLNLRDIATSPTAQDNFGYVGSVLGRIWDLTKAPILYVWNEIILKLILHQVSERAGETFTATSTLP